MKDNEKRGSSFANFLLVGAALTGTFAVAAPAVAQDAGDETIVVTGSRIARPGLVSTTPVQVVGTERLEQQGYENIQDVLQTLPQFAPSFGASRTQSTFSGATASGLNVTNLRNLGSRRSLTLVNGRRAPAGVVDASGVDLNTIPSANIARIEVITGGAAATYGADAVAGVVNIITDDSFEGVEFGFSYGEAFDTADNQNPSAFLRIGSQIGDNGHFSTTVQYDYQGQVSCRDRYLCAEDFFWQPPAAPNRSPSARSGVPVPGRFFTAAGGDYTFRNGSLATFSVAADGYNRNGQRTLAIPTERLMLASEANYEFAPGLRAFVELNYGSSETVAPFEGHPFQSNNDQIGGVLEPTIPYDNPFIPASLRAQMDPVNDSEITWWQRFDALSPRGATNTRQTVRFVTGLEGDLETLGGIGSDWTWEVSYVFGRTTLDSITNGLVSRQNLYDALRVEPDPGNPGQFRCVSAIARAQGCIPVNVFDGYNANETAFLTVSAGTTGQHELENGLAYISGSVFELPAGPLQTSFGVESRRVTANLDYADPINRGVTTGNQIGDNEETTFRTSEAFFEAVVPILSDVPLAHSLNLEGGYRVSDSSNFGTYDTWRYGGDWTPVPGIRFRAMQARSVRAPLLDEVTGIGQTAGVIQDPCTDARRNASVTRAANCLADGVPAGYVPPIVVEQSVQGFIGGNPDLEPEVADTLTYGFVINAGDFSFVPDWFSTFSLTVDRFEIEVEGLINTIGRQTIADLCYDTAGGGRAIFCNQITRGTNPAVPGANYVLTDVDDQLQNIAATKIAGVDVEASWSIDFETAGRLSFNTVWTFYDEAEITPLPNASAIDLLGFAGGSTSDQGFLERQGSFTTRYELGDLGVALTSRFIPQTAQSPFQSAVTPDVPAVTYHDVNVRYALTPGLTVYGGVNNATDEAPPFFSFGNSGTQALDTVPAYYDVFGRSWYAGFRMKF